MRTDKLHAITLRQDGKSYSQISDILGVSRSTLSNWFKDIEWSRDLYSANFKRNFAVERLARMREARLKKLENHYLKAKNEALAEFEMYRHEPLFIAGLMLYVGEGDNLNKNGLVRITNSRHFPIHIFKKFLEKYCNPHHQKAKIWVLLYPDLIKEECERWWSEKVISQFQDVISHRWEEVLKILNNNEMATLNGVIQKLTQGLVKKDLS
jgi:transcriptional regulator with XRE-family HTH domain